MKKLLPVILILLGCNSEPVITDKLGGKTCESELGILKIDVNGYSIGKKTELTELARLLKDGECDVIEITYQLRGSYGADVPKKILYDKKNKILKEMYTQSNMVEDYTNISVEALDKFLKKGKKSFTGLSE